MADIEYAVIGKAQVVRLKGDFILSKHYSALTDALARCLEVKAPCVVVNWAEIGMLGEDGFEALWESEERILMNGGAVRNCCLPQRYVDIVNMLKGPRLFTPLFETEQQATDSCAESGPLLGS